MTPLEKITRALERDAKDQDEGSDPRSPFGACLRLAVEALRKLTVDEPLQGRGFKGNANLTGCEDFYKGYNGGIDQQFKYSRERAEAVLAKIAALLPYEGE